MIMKKTKRVTWAVFWKYFRAHYWLYIMIIPAMVYLFIFHYIPMYGVVIPFFNYNIIKGLSGSEWVGLDNYKYLFQSPDFLRVLKNSIILNLERLVWGMPAPLILALIINVINSSVPLKNGIVDNPVFNTCCITITPRR